MDGECSDKDTSRHSAIPNCVWKLKRYGRFLPKPKATTSELTASWKIFESSESAGQLEFSIVGSAHLLVSQGQELLEGFSLLDAQSFLKIQRKSDSLLFNITVKGVSRLFRLQFDGSSRAAAVGFCAEAAQKLQDYVPVLTTPSPAAAAAAAAAANPEEPSTSTQEQQAPEDAPQAAPAVSMTSLSIKHLSEYFLGERELSLPMAYHQCTLPPGGLEALLRLCLLDAGFPAFVEEVENKLKKILQE